MTFAVCYPSAFVIAIDKQGREEHTFVVGTPQWLCLDRFLRHIGGQGWGAEGGTF